MGKQANTNVIRFKCQKCTVGLKVPMSLAGQYMECPSCKQRTPVPDSQADADAPPDYEVNMLAYDVPKRCMKCKRKMPKGAVICVRCGFDYRGGKQLEVEDDTLKEGEPTRGRPSAIALSIEIGLFVAAIGAFLFRSKTENLWEIGLYFGSMVYLVPAIIGHFMQWAEYREVPWRDTPTKEMEDHAERAEARQPLGHRTALYFFLCMSAGMLTGFYVWPNFYNAKQVAQERKVQANPEAIREASVVATKLGDAYIAANFFTINELFSAELKAKENVSDTTRRFQKARGEFGLPLRFSVSPIAADPDDLKAVNVPVKNEPGYRVAWMRATIASELSKGVVSKSYECRMMIVQENGKKVVDYYEFGPTQTGDAAPWWHFWKWEISTE